MTVQTVLFDCLSLLLSISLTVYSIKFWTLFVLSVSNVMTSISSAFPQRQSRRSIPSISSAWLPELVVKHFLSVSNVITVQTVYSIHFLSISSAWLPQLVVKHFLRVSNVNGLFHPFPELVVKHFLSVSKSKQSIPSISSAFPQRQSRRFFIYQTSWGNKLLIYYTFSIYNSCW